MKSWPAPEPGKGWKVSEQHTSGKLRVNEDSGQIGDVWSVDHDKPFCQIQATGPHREDIYQVERKANAKEVVRRWNSYTAMLEALEEFPREHDYPSSEEYRGACYKWWEIFASPALAQARGEESGL